MFRQLVTLLGEVIDEWHWRWQFARSRDALRRLADHALAEHEAGLTEPLDLDAAYCEMAADEEHEAEALEWIEAMVGDVADESWYGPS
jgi:hypothetical protein